MYGWKFDYFLAHFGVSYVRLISFLFWSIIRFLKFDFILRVAHFQRICNKIDDKKVFWVVIVASVDVFVIFFIFGYGACLIIRGLFGFVNEEKGE